MAKGLDSFTTEELLKVKAGDISGLSTEKLEILRDVLSRSMDVSAPQAPVQVTPPAPAPTQRLRTMAQGLTLGAADEMEARLRSAITGETYEQALEDVRGKLKAYQQQAPLESLGYEALGGIVPAVGATMMTGGAAAPVTIPRVATSVAPLVKALAGTTALGGAQGGITGFMTGEGDLFQRASRVPQATITGATLAPAVQLSFMGLGKLSDTVLDAVRRMAGGRGSKAAEAEIQRLASESGLTNDEIIQRIANGQIMAENQTLLAAVRGLYAQGGQAGTTIQKALQRRPDQLRKEALTDMQQKLVSGLDPNFVGPRPQNENVLRYFRATDDAARAIENEAYKQAYGTGGIIGQDLLESMTEALKKSPRAVDDINAIYTATTGKKPFFTVDKKGEITFNKTPTLEDAEIVRRGIKASIDSAYTSGRGGVGEALKPVEAMLREAIDTSSGTLAGARRQAAERRSARDAFKEGRTVLSKSADEVAIYMEQIADNPGAVNAFRAGTMDAIRNQMGTGRAKSMMGLLANPDTKQGAILRTIYPGDELDGILSRISTAAESQAAKTYVLGGSPTTPTAMQAQRFGAQITAEDVSNVVSGSPMALYRVASKFVGQNTRGLPDADRQRIAQILVSEDPNLVRNALQDESALAALQEKIYRYLPRVGRAAGLSVGNIGATAPNPLRSGME